MTKRFEGKTAIVTGAGSGIGEATAMQLAREGAIVFVNSLTDSGQKVVDSIQQEGHKAYFVQGDVSTVEGVQSIVDQTLAISDKIDLLFNNAGIEGMVAPVENYAIEVFDKVIATNLRGHFLMIKQCLAHMKEGSVILNCSSLHGTIGLAYDAAYSASKHAVIGLTKSLGIEFAAKGIRVNAICPGATYSVMMSRFAGDPGVEAQIKQATPMGRFAQPEEIARTACHLLSDESTFMTGSHVVVDGGYGII